MKLAEALQERADLNARIEQLRYRIVNNVLVQEGEKPAEDPEALIKELNGCLDRLQYLMARINITNCEARAGDMSLTELIAKKDSLRLKLSAYRTIIDNASHSASRARGTEIKILPTVKAADLQKTADRIAKELRLTDNALQQANWLTDLME